jgi:hypothetical protein
VVVYEYRAGDNNTRTATRTHRPRRDRRGRRWRAVDRAWAVGSLVVAVAASGGPAVVGRLFAMSVVSLENECPKRQPIGQPGRDGETV